MKKIIGLIGFTFLCIFSHAQTVDKSNVNVDTLGKTTIVEAACGECKFGMPGTGCVLAVRMDGKPYLVDGAGSIDNYGDAHAADGMCNMIRKATVTGEIKGNRYVAKSFQLLPPAKKTE